MAETLSAVRPSYVGYNTLVTSTTSPISRLFDTNDENYAYTVSAARTHAKLGGFNFSAIPDNAKITNISATIKGRAASSSAVGLFARLVEDETTAAASGYVDLGDGEQQFYKGTTLTTETIDFPVAASVCTVAFLKNDGLRLRLYQDSGPNRIYAAYLNVTYEVPVMYTLTVTAGAGGTVTGGGTYENGTTATLTATPSTGYKFKQWSDGNTNATRTITVTTDATYTAQFEKLTFNVSAAVTPAEGGTVSGAGVYSYGDTATLTATPNEGYKFKQWSDGVTSESRSFTVTAAASFTAIFEKAATSNTFRGTSRQTAYRGTEKQAVYIGNKKI